MILILFSIYLKKIQYLRNHRLGYEALNSIKILNKFVPSHVKVPGCQKHNRGSYYI